LIARMPEAIVSTASRPVTGAAGAGLVSEAWAALDAWAVLDACSSDVSGAEGFRVGSSAGRGSGLDVSLTRILWE
jgi:hypothetical protein